jgi:DNA-directed RNA polymerase subunit A'
MLNLPRKEAIDLLYSIGVSDFKRLPKKDIISGKEIFSMVIPDDFNFQGFSKNCRKDPVCLKEKCDIDAYVVIKNGKLVSGIIDKANLGEGSGLMLRNLHKQYGADQTLEILSMIFRLGVMTLLRYGFTTGISDTDLPEEAKQKIDTTLKEADEKSKELIKQYEEGELESIPGRSVLETLELKILELLNKARNDTGNLVLKYADKSTHTSIMAESGSRGNIINLAQMAACVGQQAMRGSRITTGYKDRTLSCFKKGDLTPSARGFIRHGFKDGMTPSEFFFGAMTGRDSLMDTALRTPRSGYLYRRLANALQDLKCEYDNTVRDASGKIIQFSYGEDGIDVAKSENGHLNVKRIINKVIAGE